MDFREMRYFLAVAEELHFRRAAEVLHLSQPSLSQQIRRMEKQIGARLFERTNRKVALTPAGEALLPRIRDILRRVDEAEYEARRIDQGLTGLLTLSFGSAALVGVLPCAMKEFQMQAPDVDLQLKECEPREQIANILQRTTDLGFMHAKLDDDALRSMVIQRDELIAALPSDLTDGGPVDLCNYKHCSAIMPSPFTSFGFYGHVQGVYQLMGVNPDKVLYTNLITGGIHLVAAGMGIALVPSSFQTISIPGVVYCPLLKPAPPVELLAVWRRDSASKLLYRFLDILCRRSGVRALTETVK
jgi:DNA-binding transcriptional LysR family regulator